MGEDARLDDFAGDTGTDGDGDEGDDGTPRGSGADESRGESDAVEPAAPISRWRPDAACDRCGDPAPRRWRVGEEWVCADCDPWE